MRGIDVAVQEMDDHGLAAHRQELLRRLGHRGLVERRQHLAVGIHALGHFQAVFALDQRVESAAQAVGLRARAAAELQHVAEAPGGDQADPGDLALEQRVGGGRRAVDDGLHGSRIGAGRGQRRHEADGLVVDRGRHLGELHGVGSHVDRQKIGEGAADIDADGEGTEGHDQVRIPVVSFCRSATLQWPVIVACTETCRGAARSGQCRRQDHVHTERYCSRRGASAASSAIDPPKRIWPFSMI